jgi:NMD protein affecting ribosome stability and mRNA decay
MKEEIRKKREERRKMLSDHPEDCVRGYKDITLIVKEKNDFMDSLKKHIEKILTLSFHHKLISIELLNENELTTGPRPSNIECHIVVQTKSDEKIFSQTLILPVKWYLEAPRRHAEYYEAKIQVRGADAKLFARIKKALEKNGVVIAKEIPLKEGVDLYVDSHHRGLSTIESLRKKIGGIVTRSKTLSGIEKMTGDKKYRGTILYRKN